MNSPMGAKEQVLRQTPSVLGGFVRLFSFRPGCKNMNRSKGKGGLTESLLILTGTMGAGKTSVLGEASDILAQRQIVHAAVNLDAFGLAHLPTAARSDDVMYDNLRSIYRNYAALGVQRFLVARAIEDSNQLKICRDIIPAVNTVVCRLTAGITEMKRRVQLRDLGMSQREYVARVAKLDVILDRARLEDFVVANESRSLTDVALEVLVKAGWISN
jgi:hypothetical protein